MTIDTVLGLTIVGLIAIGAGLVALEVARQQRADRRAEARHVDAEFRRIIRHEYPTPWDGMP